MPASEAIGTSLASGAAASSTISSVMAWTTPATGVFPPLLTLVIVRAMAPVAGMPPSMADATLAAPCATSSILDLCREPIMPSATVADKQRLDPCQQGDGQGWSGQLSRLSKSEMRQMRAGSMRGSSPKRAPMVSTGSLNIQAIRVAPIIAINIAGNFGVKRVISTIAATVPSPTSVVGRLNVPKA